MGILQQRNEKILSEHYCNFDIIAIKSIEDVTLPHFVVVPFLREPSTNSEFGVIFWEC